MTPGKVVYLRCRVVKIHDMVPPSPAGFGPMPRGELEVIGKDGQPLCDWHIYAEPGWMIDPATALAEVKAKAGVQRE